MKGQVIGGSVRILERIGEGGMGTVYKGVDTMLEREVAVKALRADLAHRPQIVQRFRSEAVTLARLNHPNVATLYSFLREGDDFFMVMEFVQGRPLDELIERRGALPMDQAVDWFCQALDGIHHAHQLGIVHRDVKPANVMITDGGLVKVMDFGIARVLGAARMTRTGHLIGTLEYMSPEQIRGQDVDTRSDIYALGILLYEMLTGRVPFEAESDYDLMRAHMEQMPRPPRVLAPDLNTAVEDVVLRALEKEPGRRFQTAEAFRDALQAAGGLAPPAVAAPIHSPLPPTRIAEAPGAEAPSAPVDEGTEAAASDEAPSAPVAVVVAAPGAPTRATRVASGDEVAAEAPKPTRAAAVPETGTYPAPTRRAASSRPATRGPKAPERGSQAPVRRFNARHYAAVAAVVILMVTGVLALRGRGGLPPAQPGQGEVIEPTSEEHLLTDVVPEQPSNVDPEPPPASTDTDAGSVTDGPGIWSADARPVQVQVDLTAILTKAQAYFEANQLTTPAGENALDLCLRVLGIDADNTEAANLLRRIAERYAAWGDARLQGGHPEQAIAHYQKSLEVAQRFPRVPAAFTRALQQKLADASAAAERTAGPAEDARPGTVRIVVRPFGDVYVDGRRKARETNQVHDEALPPGTYRIRAVHPTFGTWEKTVAVQPGQTEEVLFNFNVTFKLTVTSEPTNAEILIDGVSTGRYTPSVVSVRPGRHTIEVRKDGYAPGTQQRTIEQQTDAPLHFALQRK